MVTNYFFTPGVEPISFVTLAKAKKQLRIEASFTDEDEIIQIYIDAAEKAAEDYLNKKLQPGVMTFESSDFVNPFVFVQSDENDTVASIEYYPKDSETLTALETTEFKLRKSSSIGCKEIKYLATTPATATQDDAVVIKINQGFTVAQLPKPIYQAMLLMITTMFERREDIGEIGNNLASRNLMRPYRNF